MDEAARAALCARGLADIFDPELRDVDRARSSRTSATAATPRCATRWPASTASPSRPDELRVTADEIAAAVVSPAVDAALDDAIAHCRAFNEQVLARAADWSFEPEPGLRRRREGQPDRLGRAVRAVGQGELPERRLPARAPAVVAGVPSIAVVVPPIPGGDGSVDPAVLVVCRKLGITDVFRVNGPAGIAALGFGTESIPEGAQDRRPRLAGRHARPGRAAAPRRRHDDAARADREPGHRRRQGRSAAPGRRPADRGRARHRLVGRARHDVGRASPTPPTPSWPASSPTLPAVRAEAARASLGVNGGCVLVDDLDDAVDVANRYAPEHLQVAVADDVDRRRRRRPAQRRRDPRRPAHPVQRGELRDRLPGVAADVGLRRGVVGHHRRGVPQAHRHRPGRCRGRWRGCRRRSSPSPTTRASPPTPRRSGSARADLSCRTDPIGPLRTAGSGQRSPSSPASSPRRRSPSGVWPPARGSAPSRPGSRVAERARERVGLGQQLLDDPGLGAHDARLRGGDGVRRERGDARREAVDERRQLVGRQHPVDPPPPLGGGGVDVVAAEDRLERPAAADQARQAHGAGAAGDDAERDLGLVEDRRRAGEAHVAAQRQLAARHRRRGPR